MPRMPTHIQFGVIRRSRAQSARARQAYQSCGVAITVTGDKLDFRSHRHQHLGTQILLPPGGDEALLNPDVFIAAIEQAERRYDAQECRTLDFDLPRGLKLHEMLPAAAFIIAPLVHAGMAAQVDVECPMASDGGEHPHAHVMLAMRELHGSHFGAKRRDWNTWFTARNGREMRALIAARLTLVAAICGLDIVADPRTSHAKGASPPLLRLPRGVFNNPRPEDHELLAELREARVNPALEDFTSDQSASVPESSPNGTRDIRLWPIWCANASEADGTTDAASLQSEPCLGATWVDGWLTWRDQIDNANRARTLADAARLIIGRIQSLHVPFLAADGDIELLNAVGLQAAMLTDPVVITTLQGRRCWQFPSLDNSMTRMLAVVADLTGANELAAQVMELTQLFAPMIEPVPTGEPLPTVKSAPQTSTMRDGDRCDAPLFEASPQMPAKKAKADPAPSLQACTAEVMRETTEQQQEEWCHFSRPR
jgi:hypothetical protein